MRESNPRILSDGYRFPSGHIATLSTLRRVRLKTLLVGEEEILT